MQPLTDMQHNDTSGDASELDRALGLTRRVRHAALVRCALHGDRVFRVEPADTPLPGGLLLAVEAEGHADWTVDQHATLIAQSRDFLVVLSGPVRLLDAGDCISAARPARWDGRVLLQLRPVRGRVWWHEDEPMAGRQEQKSVSPAEASDSRAGSGSTLHLDPLRTSAPPLPATRSR
jgi:hypothetical protein